ncbi:PfaB family protein [Psychromonas algicola]|uniref:PfaB family protein n=1 Tax=Psychromonas algicola TaxID=2555642 RepID=UPI001067B77D|nr:PfaB family protein [Psychromonas sp. RZ5]TEW53000.1 PfaB family protein [Psychromonas sp. RZ5]
MLSVIGLEVCFDSVKDIDAFDYHLYCNLPIAVNTENSFEQVIDKTVVLIDGILTTNHLFRSETHLISLNEPSQTSLSFEKLTDNFASVNQQASLNEALDSAQVISEDCNAPVLILSINENAFDGVAALLVCDQVVAAVHPQIKVCYQYAVITANVLNANIQSFLTANNLVPEQVESIVLNESQSESQRDQHQSIWLEAFKDLYCQSSLTEASIPNTLLTEVDLIKNSSGHFDFMLCLISAILSVDQRYRIGCEHELLGDFSQEEWQAAGLYYLADSTSYLSNKGTKQRHVIVSNLSLKQSIQKQQLVLVSETTSLITKAKKSKPNSKGGFLAQQSDKPVIFYAADCESLLAALNLTQTRIENAELQDFTAFAHQQYQSYEDLNTQSLKPSHIYCVVLIASSFVRLSQQLKLAFSGLAAAIESAQVWKTPVGSYCSGQLVAVNNKVNPVSFIYPGVGALYVGMGKDLLRLFPESYEQLSAITDDLAYSFQDHLMTPRLATQPDATMKAKQEQSLRAELANIAEAGVSYACLLTSIFQEQLSIKATSAAGYSMGEVSMFAALGCWKTPQLLGQRLRQSKIFTEQLSGPLKRLHGVWDKENSESGKQWESYYLKAGLMQVESVLEEFPRVYITIVNTPDSLVIAGEPSQCLALAKCLSIRALPLDVPNIIHCDLAKSEYESMKALYALPVNSSVHAKLFSSSCYLPVPVTEKAIAVSISKCLTEQVDFPHLIKAIYSALYQAKADNGNHAFIEMGAGKSLSTWIDRILETKPVTCLSVNQKNLDDYSGILKTIAPLISLGHPINLQSFFSGSLVRKVEKMTRTTLVS